MPAPPRGRDDQQLRPHDIAQAAMTRRLGVAGAPRPAILALNVGRSSLEFGLYEPIDGQPRMLASGVIDDIGVTAAGRLRVLDRNGDAWIDDACPTASVLDAVTRISRLLDESRLPTPGAIGHRIVHAGTTPTRPSRISVRVLGSLDAAALFAPPEAAAALAVVRQTMTRYPGRPQVACFDAEFHTALPMAARRLPIGRLPNEAAIERSGLHGLCCESVLQQIALLGDGKLPARIVIAHLGDRASVTAIRGGRPVDLGSGLMTATRSGDLDPGLLLGMLGEPGWSRERIATLIEAGSGLLGVSGVSGDLRRLQAVAAANADARLAITMYGAAVARQIAAVITAIDGIDLLVFTGSLGEHDSALRSAICARLGWCGIVLYPRRNAECINPLSAAGSRCRIMALPALETEQIARMVAALLPEFARPMTR